MSSGLENRHKYPGNMGTHACIRQGDTCLDTANIYVICGEGALHSVSYEAESKLISDEFSMPPSKH